MVKGSIEWEYDADNGLVLHIKPLPAGLIEGEVHQHMLAARKEMLLALRGLIDFAVKHTEAKESQSSNSGTRIKVD